MLLEIIVWAVPLILAITLHEVSHGWAALQFGDDTAKQARRLSLNPIRHVDPVGTILIPGLLYLAKSPFLFGYAKPVPVNFSRLRPFRLGMFMVALAGPATNIVLAMLSASLLHVEGSITPEEAPWLFRMIYISIQVNCVLAVLNLLPILPLDGGRMVSALLPTKARLSFDRTEKFGFVIIILILASSTVSDIDLAQMLIVEPSFWVMEHVLAFTGNGQISESAY